MGLEQFGDYFIAAQALNNRDDRTESDISESADSGGNGHRIPSTRYRLRKIIRKILHLVKWEIRAEGFKKGVYQLKNRRHSITDSPEKIKLALEKGMIDRRPTRMIRLAMTVQPGKRTPQMIELIRPYISRLKCCEALNSKVRNQLPTIVEYECLGQGRTIVKQGDPGESYYLIVSGTVDVMIEEGGINRYLNILKSGQGFGEVALVNKGPRTASIVTKEPTELLRIDRDQFHEVLRASKLQEIARKQSFLRAHPSFVSLPEEVLKKFVDNAVIKAYKPAEMIVRVGEETVDHIVIVISGECFVETKVALDYYKLRDGRFLLDLPSATRPDLQRYRTHLASPAPQGTHGSTTCSSRTMITPSPNMSSNVSQSSATYYTGSTSLSNRSSNTSGRSVARISEEGAVSRYRQYFSNDVKSVSSKLYHLCLRRIGPQEYFSVSDFIVKNRCNVGPVKKCECLLLPKILFTRFNMMPVLEEMSATELCRTLSIEEAFEGFLRRRHWELYKKRLVADILKKKSNR